MNAMTSTLRRPRFRPIDRHHRAARALGFALTTRDWAQLFICFAAYLENAELAGIACAAIDALPDDLRADLVSALADAILGPCEGVTA